MLRAVVYVQQMIDIFNRSNTAEGEGNNHREIITVYISKHRKR